MSDKHGRFVGQANGISIWWTIIHESDVVERGEELEGWSVFPLLVGDRKYTFILCEPIHGRYGVFLPLVQPVRSLSEYALWIGNNKML